jgi:hypothetical protein
MKTDLLAIPVLCLGLGMLPTPLACAVPHVGAALPVVHVPDGARVTMEPSVADLSFLAGSWHGTHGTSTWESVYSGAEGGMIVGASKELRGGRVVMIDFEHFYERDGSIYMTPFPFGNRSMEFPLTSMDVSARRAVFVNEANDFPSRFTYEATSRDHLKIELAGEMDGEPVTFVLEFDRR